MRLGLSSEAAPGASAAELVDTCARRGLPAVEITLGAGTNPLDVLEYARAFRVTLSGLLRTEGEDVRELAALSRRTAAPVIVGGNGSLEECIGIARAIIAASGNARVLVRGNAQGWLRTVTDAHVPFAWQIDDTCDDPAGDAALIPLHAGRIEYVRLVGGGPETALQEGRGVGAVMRTLALAGYDGPLILTPSSQRFRVAWSAWLGRRGGWGCGSAAEARSIIPLQT